ncbi:MAG: disulfide bond formation protein B [Pseudomonadota bacterium]
MIAPRTLGLLAALGSLGILAGAFAFQHLGGLAPCPMCLWQRWPHAASGLVLAGLLIGLPMAAVASAGLLTMGISTGLGAFHSGVERGWWDGPQTCAAGSIDGLSTSDLLDQILEAPLIRCTDITWDFLGLSMANWNTAASLVFMVLWAVSLRQALRD